MRTRAAHRGLVLWHGAQIAVDATLVSPVTCEGLPQAGAAAHPRNALRNAAQPQAAAHLSRTRWQPALPTRRFRFARLRLLSSSLAREVLAASGGDAWPCFPAIAGHSSLQRPKGSTPALMRADLTIPDSYPTPPRSGSPA